MGLFSRSAARHPLPTHPDSDRFDPTAREELGILGLMPDSHRCEQELRHSSWPDPFFAPDPHRVMHDIA